MPYRESAATPLEHAVNFYDNDADLVAAVASFLGAGLTSGEPAVVVASRNHRALLDAALERLGHDPDGARRSGRLRTLDAQETLATFMRQGAPDPARFRSSIGGVIDAAAESGLLPVRVFGEMVALLWQQGSVSGAVTLEAMWNDLALDRDFTLLCAYPATTVDDTRLLDLHRVCALHSNVVPPRSYLADAGRPAGPDTRQDSRAFICAPAAVQAVRRFVSEVLTGWGEDEVLGDATLVASELATNAVRHASSPFRVSLDRSGSSLRVAVEDVYIELPEMCRPDNDATNGRGVFIVDRVCRRWGSEQLPRGKVVWGELTPLAAETAG